MKNNKNMQTAFKSLPIVDISNLYSKNLEDRKEVAKKLGEAAQNIGFLYITGHNIEKEKINKLKAITKKYFEQSHDTKMKNYIGKSSNHSGYVPEGEEVYYGGSKDLKECYDVNYDYTASPQIYPMVGPTQWPEMDEFKEVVKDYYDSIFDLGKTLIKGFALSLGIKEDAFLKFVNNPPSQLRLIHYPANLDKKSEKAGIAAHTDYECFTMLLPTAPGLEVLNGANEWIDVPLIEDAFVINIGDMLEVLSNGNFIATSHRVRKVQEERYAFPFFFACDYTTEIKPLSNIKARNKDSTYESVICGDHLYTQTMHIFRYLQEKLKKGEVSFPKNHTEIAAFGKFKDIKE